MSSLSSRRKDQTGMRQLEIMESKGQMLAKIRELSAEMEREVALFIAKMAAWQGQIEEYKKINRCQDEEIQRMQRMFAEEKPVGLREEPRSTTRGAKRKPSMPLETQSEVSQTAQSPKRRRAKKEKISGYKSSDCDTMSQQEMAGYLAKLQQHVSMMEPTMPSDTGSSEGSAPPSLQDDLLSDEEDGMDEYPEETRDMDSTAGQSDDSEEAGVFEVERVIQIERPNCGVITRRTPAFFIYWYGYRPHACSLVSLEDMKGCAGKLDEIFEKEEGYRAVFEKMKSEGHNPKRFMLVSPAELMIGEKKMSDTGWNRRLNLPQNAVQKKLWEMKKIEREWNVVTENVLEPPIYLDVFFEDGLANLPSKFKYTADIQLTPKTDKLYRTINKKCSCLCGQELCDYCRNKTIAEPFVPLQNGPFKGFQEHVFSYTSKLCSKDSQCSPECPSRRVPDRQVPLLVCYEPKIQGFGVRALTDIPAGSIVCEYTGEAFHESELKEYKRVSRTSYQFEIKGGEIVIDARNYGSVSRFFNHNCEPNVCCVHIFKGKRVIPKLYFATMRDISKGEALVIDYHSEYKTSHPNDPRKSILLRLPNSSPCLCDSKYCRKQV